MRSFLDDIRQAVRLLVKHPRFVAAIVLPLALGIGANSAVFGMVDAVLFRPLPVREADRLVRVYAVFEQSPSALDGSSYPAYLDYRDAAPVFRGLAAFSDPAPVNLSTGGGTAERVPCTLVSGNYFEVLGVAAERGRLLERADDGAPGASPVVVISDRLWRRRFGADPAAVGSAVRINGREFTVAGVTPTRFVGLDLETAIGVPDLWAPIAMTDAVLPELAEKTALTSRGFGWLQIVGRLAPGATLDQAQAQLDAVAALRDERGAVANRRDPTVRARPAVDASVDPTGDGRTTRLARLLFGIVACVLLIACADAAGLLVVRAEERKREMAIRQALGASGGRIARQLVVESLLVAGLSALVGVVFAVWLSDILVALSPFGFVLAHESASPVVGTRVLFFTTLAAALTGILFGTAPVVDGSRAQLTPMLKNEATFVSAIGGRFRLRYAFVVFQVALSTVLLVGAALLIRTLWNAYRVDLGFETTNLVVGSVDVSKQGYNEVQRRQVFERILDEVRTMPGVRSAALARTVPVQRSVMRMAVVIDGVDLPSNEESNVNVVGPHFFTTLGVPLLRGRVFDAFDTEHSPGVIVVNQAFADRYWPNGDPIGKHLKSPAPGKDAEIVGVVANFKLRSLREARTPVMFAAAAQFYLPRMTIAVRTESDPAAAMGLLRAAVARVDPELPLFNVRTADEQLGLALANERMVAGLLVTFAIIAVVLAATGFYALFSYLMRLRAREFAIRIALGAGRTDLVGLVVGRSATLAALGITAGLAAAFLLSGALTDLLFGVAPFDATSVAASAMLLLAVPTLASYIPARRAARVDPAAALRHE